MSEATLTTSHLVLLGDSVFDNAAYTDGGPAVIEHLRRSLTNGWRADLLAVDGSTTEDICDQLAQMPGTATHLVLSVGGNNALLRADVLETPVTSSGEALVLLAQASEAFRVAYAQALTACLAVGKPLVICTIYNGNFPDPNYQLAATTALASFNDVIVRAAVDHELRVLDLRLVCNTPADFANPLEPSIQGGEKIAAAIARAVTEGRFMGAGAHLAR